MAANCGGSLAKCLLILFNVVFLIGGVTLLALGAYLLLDDSLLEIANLANYIDTDENVVKKLCYGCIIIGACIVLLSILGMVGASVENKCLLGTYMFIVIVLLIGNAIIIGFSIRYKDKMTTKIEESIEKKLGDSDYSGAFKKSMDVMQIELKCCGVANATDYSNSKFQQNSTLKVPMSCCVLNNVNYKDYIIEDKNVKNATECQNEYDEVTKSGHKFLYLHNEGCSDELQNWIKEKAFILIGVGFGIIGIEILGIIFALCLCRNRGE